MSTVDLLLLLAGLVLSLMVFSYLLGDTLLFGIAMYTLVGDDSRIYFFGASAKSNFADGYLSAKHFSTNLGFARPGAAGSFSTTGLAAF